MKKSELKEMIRQALSEGDDKQTEKQAWWDKNKSTMQNLFGVDSFKELMMALGSASSTQVHKEGEIKEGVWSVLPARIPEFIQAVEDLKDEYHGVVGSDAVYDGLDAAIMAAKELLMNTAEVGDMPGFEGTMDDLDSLSIREAEEDEEEVDIDIDAEEDEELEDIEPETIPTAGLTGEMKEISDALEAALENARDLGDEKLVNQIGNTITYFTRAHVVKGGEEIGIEEGKEDGSKWFSKLDYLDSKGYNPARFNLMLKKHYGFKGSDEEAKVIVNQWKNSNNLEREAELALETLRMQKLAGVITERDYKTKANEITAKVSNPNQIDTTNEFASRLADFAETPEAKRLLQQMSDKLGKRGMEAIQKSVASVNESDIDTPEFEKFLKQNVRRWAPKLKPRNNEDILDTAEEVAYQITNFVRGFAKVNILSMGMLPALTGAAIEYLGGPEVVSKASEIIGDPTATAGISVLATLLGSMLVWKLADMATGENTDLA